MWTIGKGFDSEYPRKVRYGFGQPQNGVTWSWEDNKSCTIATVSDEVEESLQVFVPKKLCNTNWVEELQNLCNVIWLADNCLSHWRNVKPLQHHQAGRCQTSSWSSPWLSRHLGFLPWECWGWARSRDCDWNWTKSCHRHRDHTSPQYYGNVRTDLIRLVSTKFGQTHWTITPVLAKLILFWDEVVEKEWGEMGIQIHPMTGKTCSFMLSLFVRLCHGNKNMSKLTPRLRVSAMTPCFATI